MLTELLQKLNTLIMLSPNSAGDMLIKLALNQQQYIVDTLLTNNDKLTRYIFSQLLMIFMNVTINFNSFDLFTERLHDISPTEITLLQQREK
jgi:uncharacterized protein YjfI (DUF2170 family)